MHTLTELQSYFAEQGIASRKYNGFQIIVGKDIWGLAHGDFYCNNVVTNPKDKKLLDIYKQNKPTMFKAMGSRFYNIEDDAGLV